MPEKKYEIPEDVLNATIRYLESRPWKEANDLIYFLKKCKPIENLENEKI